jgi:hypothetical protein
VTGPRALRLALLALIGVLGAAGAPAPARGAELPLGSIKLVERRSTSTLAPGVAWTRIVRTPAPAPRGQRPPPGGRWVVNVLTIDRRRLAGRLSAVLSNDRVAGRETVSSMARRRGAIAGVNGGFFVAKTGDPVGALAIGGRLVSESVDGRSSLLVPRSVGTPAAIAALGFRGSVRIAGRRRHLDGVDRVRGEIPNCGGRGGDYPTEHPRHAFICTDPSELVVLTSRFGARTLTGAGGVETVVRGGVVASTRNAGNTHIPRDGYVLSGSGDAATFLRVAAQPGTHVSLEADLMRGAAPLGVGGYEAVVSGGPRLLTSGQMTVRGLAEGFGPLFGYFVASRHPRTLAGVTADGRVLLVTVDGRRFGVSIGVTLYEAARLMRTLGARDALNLDGGGSATMTVGGRVVNYPSDLSGERSVSDGVFVLR